MDKRTYTVRVYKHRSGGKGTAIYLSIYLSAIYLMVSLSSVLTSHSEEIMFTIKEYEGVFVPRKEERVRLQVWQAKKITHKVKT